MGLGDDKGRWGVDRAKTYPIAVQASVQQENGRGLAKAKAAHFPYQPCYRLAAIRKRVWAGKYKKMVLCCGAKDANMSHRIPPPLVRHT